MKARLQFCCSSLPARLKRWEPRTQPLGEIERDAFLFSLSMFARCVGELPQRAFERHPLLSECSILLHIHKRLAFLGRQSRARRSLFAEDRAHRCTRGACTAGDGTMRLGTPETKGLATSSVAFSGVRWMCQRISAARPSSYAIHPTCLLGMACPIIRRAKHAPVGATRNAPIILMRTELSRYGQKKGRENGLTSPWENSVAATRIKEAMP